MNVLLVHLIRQTTVHWSEHIFRPILDRRRHVGHANSIQEAKRDLPQRREQADHRQLELHIRRRQKSERSHGRECNAVSIHIC